MKLKNIAFMTTLFSMVALTGCSFFSAPSSMIKPPESISVASGISKNMTDIVKNFLPRGARLANPQNPQGSSGIQLRDLDGDKVDELIAFYEENANPGQAGIIVLKKNSNDTWRKILDYISVGYKVNYVKFLDITQDGNDDILVGWEMGSNLNGLDLFSYADNRIKRVTSDYYSKIETEDMPNNDGNRDTQTEIALWQHDIGNAYEVRVLRWNGTRLAPAPDVYEYYYKKVVQYYEQELKNSLNSSFAYYWYYLADAQIKAGNPADAYNSINSGLAIKAAHPNYYPDDIKFQNLKEKALAELNGMNITLSTNQMNDLLNHIKGTYTLKPGENYEKTTLKIDKLSDKDNYYSLVVSNTHDKIGNIVKIIKLKDDNCYEIQTIPGNSVPYNVTIKVSRDFSKLTLLELDYERDLENSGSMDVTFIKSN